MSSSYDLSLVFASYCVATIAAFSAIYFSSRVRNMTVGSRPLWFTLGAICLGVGIWSMHFVGMSAYQMPGMDMSFDLSLTAFSLVVALLAAGLGLWVITKREVSALQILGSAVVMGLGIFTMHYTGMYAMQMSPAPQYDVFLVTLSGVIAVAASGAALLICRNIESVPAKYSLLVRAAAALVMGIAICGMHYTGMFAVSFPEGVTMASENALRGNWMGLPTAVAASVFVLLLIYIAYQDYREAERARLAEKEAAEKVVRVAFSDVQTGLPNRTALEAHLDDELNEVGQAPFALVYFELSAYRRLVKTDGEEAAQAYAVDFSKAITRSATAGSYVARYNTNGFIVVLKDVESSELGEAVKTLAVHVNILVGNRKDSGPMSFAIGYSQYPQSGTLSRMLIRQAQVIKLRQADLNSDAGLERLSAATV